MLLAQRVGISHLSTRYKFILLKLIPVPMSDIASVSRPRNGRFTPAKRRLC